ESGHVEYRCRFQNHSVLSSWQLLRSGGLDGFARGDFRETFCIQMSDVRRVGFLPSGRFVGQHGNGNFRRCLRMPLTQTARIKEAFKGVSAGEYACGSQLVLFGNGDYFFNALGAILWSERRRLRKMPAGQYLCGADTLVRDGQQIRIRMLDLCQTLGGSYNALEAFVIELISRCASRPSVKYGAQRNAIIFFRNILMNDVVGKTRERGLAAVKNYIDFVGGGIAFQLFKNVCGLVFV